MSELSFEQMLEDSVKTIRNGEIVQGTVIDVKEDEIILNIGYKADGIITRNEYTSKVIFSTQGTALSSRTEIKFINTSSTIDTSCCKVSKWLIIEIVLSADAECP